MSTCWVCQGTKKCACCNGTARLTLRPPARGASQTDTITIRCDGCAGSGVCPACNGTGELRHVGKIPILQFTESYQNTSASGSGTART
jgi:hypothetical protein